MNPFHTLDNIFNNVIKVRVLRHFSIGFGGETGRELAKVALVSQAATRKPLQELTETGILTRKIVGRSHSYTLNKKNIVVLRGLLPLFQLEANLLRELGRLLEKECAGLFDSAILFGSLARGEATAESDWDVLILCKDSNAETKILKKIEAKRYQWNLLFSSSIDFRVSITKAWKEKLLNKDDLAQNIYNDYIASPHINPLCGKSLLEIIGDAS